MEYKTCKVELDIQYRQFNNYDLFKKLLKSLGKDGYEKQKAINLVTKEFKIDKLEINNELDKSLIINSIEIVDITCVESYIINTIAIVRTNIDNIKSVKIDYDLNNKLYKDNCYYIDDEKVRFCRAHIIK